jgi:hypothetical protein
LGTCEPCQCNGHATTCDPETGACIDCKHHTTGENCETCEPGYTGDARRGTPQDCQLMSSNVPCDCHNHSPRGCDSVGRCLECEHFTEGYHCERCKPGHYGDATRGTPYDCTKCPCPGASECYLDPATNEVVCKTCPPGYAGNRCQECAPGYTQDGNERLGDGRVKCKPIGQLGPGHIDYTNNRFHKQDPSGQDIHRH